MTRYLMSLLVLAPTVLCAQQSDSSEARLLKPNWKAAGTWKGSDATDKQGYRSRRFSYSGRRDELVTFTLSAAFGGRISIYAPVSGKAIRIASIDSAKQLTTVELKLPANGIYTIAVESKNAGSYTLAARSTGPVSSVDWAALYPTGGKPNEKYALLVGVNDYPGTKNDLSGGPLVDVELMRHLLVEKLGYKPANVLVLRDEEGNREQVVQAFRRHLGQAGAGGSALFYYSGHGMQLSKRPVAGMDREADGRDEALSLWGTQEEFYGYLLDDELGVLIDELKTERVLVVLDDCNSGTATRGGDSIAWKDLAEGVQLPRVIYRHVRAGPTPPVLLKSVSASDIASQLENPALNLVPRPGRARKDHILLAASDDSEQTVSVEMQLDDSSSVHVGLFTIHLFQALMSADASATFKSLVEDLRPKVMATAIRTSGAPQTLQLGGSRATAAIISYLAGTTP